MAEEPTRLGEPVELGVEDLGFDPENLVGDTLAGRYEIEQRIGKGGMGVVYLASQSALNRKVVVKVLASNLSEDDEAVTRFEREALGLSQLQHPNIVTIYDFGRDRDLAYIVMEYVEGDTISHYLRRHNFMPFDDFAGIASQTLDALSEAHDQGIIHRDIKPSNIMLCERHGHANFVKVLDFGLAKLVNDSVEVTKKQNLVGSVAFLAPEQILGLDFDQRVDVYALGVLFYYMLTGIKPFRGEDDMSVLYQHIHKEPTPLREVLPQGQHVPEEVQALIHRCLSKDPRHRPINARELLTLLQNDVSRSVFAMPWTTGEFSAVSASSISRPGMAAGPQTPSHHHTPASGMSMIPTGDISGQYGHPSHASLSSPYIYGPPPRSNRNLIIGGVAAVVVAILAVGGVMMSQQKPAGESPAQQKARLEKALVSVEGAIGEKRFGVAQTLLDTMQSELNAHPDLMTRAAGYRDTIEINKLLGDAELAKNAKDFDKARDLYEKILKRDAAHKLATEQLAALPKDQPKAAEGTVKIDSNTKARVLLDGKFIGYTPAEARVAPGAHTFEVEARGFKNWKQEVTVASGATQILDASLTSDTPTASATRTVSRPPPRRNPTPTSSKPPTNDTNTGTKPATTTTGKKPPKKDGLLFPVDGKKPSNDGGLLPVGP